MQWTYETGFNNSQSCLDYVHLQISIANQTLSKHNRLLALHIVDACYTEQYQNRFLVTNCWLEPGLLNPRRYEQFADSWYGIYAGKPSVDSTTLEKKFNCFINRMDPIRQSWLYQLVRRNIFDQGYVSFNMDISRHLLESAWPKDSTPADVFETQFQQQLQIFQPEHEVVKSMVPYRNFDPDADPTQIIMQSEFSIILETYFDRNNVITFSEKIFRCLKLPRPWILFAMKGAVQYLRNLGFDVLDDLVDHGYDQIDFSIERQSALLDLAQTMCQRTLTVEQIARCEQAAKHNQQRLQEMFDIWHCDIDQSVANAQIKCLA